LLISAPGWVLHLATLLCRLVWHTLLRCSKNTFCLFTPVVHPADCLYPHFIDKKTKERGEVMFNLHSTGHGWEPCDCSVSSVGARR
jgi:hypothetical protein